MALRSTREFGGVDCLLLPYYQGRADCNRKVQRKTRFRPTGARFDVSLSPPAAVELLSFMLHMR